jgi:CRISPR/Cas system-associated exonuclease Cas4 (RecB family)
MTGMEINTDILKRYLNDLLVLYDLKQRGFKEIYVTEIIGCQRKAWFRIFYNANPLPTPPMLLGKLLHIAMQNILNSNNYFKNCKFEVECSSDLGNGWKLKGRADVVLDDAVLEFKFTKSPQFNKARDMYYIQTSIYCTLLEKPQGFLIMIDKNKFVIDVIRVEPSKELFDESIKRAQKIIEAVESKTIPQDESPRYPFECDHCEWKIFCKDNKEKSEKKIKG